MKIKIEHLGYVIHFKKEKPPKEGLKACVIQEDANSSTIYFPLKLNLINSSILAHEVLHAIQFMCESRLIDMIKEREHVGYLMSYIMNKILGYEYDI